STSTSSFFFQAEDGIRDRNVTGVQTCALPIFPSGAVGDNLTINAQLAIATLDVIGRHSQGARNHTVEIRPGVGLYYVQNDCASRSEERRVGKECRDRCGSEQYRKRGYMVREKT